MRKYIHVAKALKPGLTREAAEFIAEEYAKLRSQDNMQNDNIARVILLSYIKPALYSFSISIEGNDIGPLDHEVRKYVSLKLYFRYPQFYTILIICRYCKKFDYQNFFKRYTSVKC